MPTLPTWLWISLGSLLIATGAWLIFNGRILRRGSRTHHCRTCRYDMTGLPSLTCPECGRTARNERELTSPAPLRTWRFAGLLALLLGATAFYAPPLQRHGWPGTLPNWLLVRWMPLDPPPSLTKTVFVISSAFPSGTFNPPARDRSVGERLYDEFDRRVSGDEISDAHLAHYYQRVYNLLPQDRARTLALPAAWPSDRPFVVTSQRLPQTFYSRGSLTCLNELTQLPSGDTGIRCTVDAWLSGRSFTVCTLERTLDVSRRESEFMTPVSGPEIDAAVAAAIDPRIRIDADSLHFYFDRRQKTPAWEKAPWFISYTIVARIDDQVVGTANADTSRVPAAGEALWGLPLYWSEGGKEAVRANPHRVRLTLTGRPERCIDDFVTVGWSYPAEAWSGTITVTPRIDPKR